MTRPTVRERMRYAFDNFMARGTISLVIGLFVLSVAIVIAIAVIATLTGETQGFSFPALLWRNLLRTLDPGTMGGDEGSPFFLALMLTVTIGGIFIIATLIGVLSAGLEGKLADLRKGRSRVIEHGHTVILGWSEQIFTVLEELSRANENQRRATVVVLADRDKVEMEDEIRSRIGSPRSIRVVCRSGYPTDLDEIDIANVQTSRAIIVLSPQTQDPDADVLKTLLAITNDSNRRQSPYHIVAVMREASNAVVARMVGRDEVNLVIVDELISRITAQACRQSGLSTVYTELLDFAGDEIYLARVPSLVGRTFGEVLTAFDRCTVIGIHDGRARLNPPMDTRLGDADQLIVIAEDDDRIHAGAPRSSASDPIDGTVAATVAPERTLVLGWNRRAARVITELDAYVAPGSAVTVVTRNVVPTFDLKHSGLEVQQGDPTDRALLDAIGVGNYDHVIVLSDPEEDPAAADARTIITLLHLRDIASKGEEGAFSITSEMLDPRNRPLAEVSRADDFIVSNRLASLLITQIAEDERLAAVFDDLFDAQGSEIYLKPVAIYSVPGRPVDFYDVVGAARRRGEVALGYRIAAWSRDASRHYGVVLNPDKKETITFDGADRVIVLAED